MSRHLLTRTFDQERFDRLKREAQTLLNTLNTTTVTPGRVHQRNKLRTKLWYRIGTIEDRGEYYYQFDDGPLSGNRLYYTLDTLENLIGRVHKFLKGG